MPSLLHELLVELFRRSAGLVAELLGPTSPRAWVDEWRVEEPGASALRDLRADLVVAGYAGERASIAMIVEIQLSRAATKRWSWPVYLASVRARYRCPASLVIVTPFRGIARWASTPIELGDEGSRVIPRVVGPERIPRVQEGAPPELAMLAAIAHREPQQVLVALDILGTLDASMSGPYTDLLLAAVGKKLVAEVKTMLDLKDYVPKTPWLREQYDLGVLAGRQEGRREGRQEGRQEGLAAALRAIIAARGMELSAAQRARIEECHDAAQLERWIARCAVADSADTLLDET